MKLLPFNELPSNFSKQFGTIQLNKTGNQPKTDFCSSQCSAVALVEGIALGFGRKSWTQRELHGFLKLYTEIWI